MKASIELDHLIVPVADAAAAARRLGELLGVPYGKAAIGPFHAVYLSDSVTLDFDSWPEPVPAQHYALRVDEASFERLVARLQAAGVEIRSGPFLPADGRTGEFKGGRLVYWSDPAPHAWELLTLSYARAPASD